jgi:hypothetical protein
MKKKLMLMDPAMSSLERNSLLHRDLATKLIGLRAFLVWLRSGVLPPGFEGTAVLGAVPGP